MREPTAKRKRGPGPYTDEMRQIDMNPDNDFPEIPEDAKPCRPRGWIYLRGRNPSNVAEIDEDLRGLFPTERAVNDALRTYAADGRIARVSEIRPGGMAREEREVLEEYDAPMGGVVIHQDLHPFFPDVDSVNDALQMMAEVIRQADVRRAS